MSTLLAELDTELSPDSMAWFDGLVPVSEAYKLMDLPTLAHIVIQAHEEQNEAMLKLVESIRGALYLAGNDRRQRLANLRELAALAGQEYDSLRQWVPCAMRFSDAEMRANPQLTPGHWYEAALRVKALPGETTTSPELRERTQAVLDYAADNNLTRNGTKRLIREVNEEARVGALPGQAAAQIAEMERPEPYFEQYVRDFEKVHLSLLREEQPGTFTSTHACAVEAMRRLRGKWNISPAD